MHQISRPNIILKIKIKIKIKYLIDTIVRVHQAPEQINKVNAKGKQLIEMLIVNTFLELYKEG